MEKTKKEHTEETKNLMDVHEKQIIELNNKIAEKDSIIGKYERILTQSNADIRKALKDYSLGAQPKQISESFEISYKKLLDDYAKKNSELSIAHKEINELKIAYDELMNVHDKIEKEHRNLLNEKLNISDNENKIKECTTILIDQQTELYQCLKKMKSCIGGESKITIPKTVLNSSDIEDQVKKLLIATRSEILSIVISLYAEMHKNILSHNITCKEKISEIKECPRPPLDRIINLIENDTKHFDELSKVAEKLNFYDSAKSNEQSWVNFQTECENLIKDAQKSIKDSLNNANIIMDEFKIVVNEKQQQFEKETLKYNNIKRSAMDDLRKVQEEKNILEQKILEDNAHLKEQENIKIDMKNQKEQNENEIARQKIELKRREDRIIKESEALSIKEKRQNYAIWIMAIIIAFFVGRTIFAKN